MPISLAYSGSIFTAVPVPAVAMCQTATIKPNRASETRPARRPSHACVICRPPSPRSGCALDGEALHVLLGLGGIELLAHHLEILAGRGGRGEPYLLH